MEGSRDRTTAFLYYFHYLGTSEFQEELRSSDDLQGTRSFGLESVCRILPSVGALGTALGRCASLLMRSILQWPTEASLPSIVAAAAVSATIGALFGLYPAWKASRLDPIERSVTSDTGEASMRPRPDAHGLPVGDSRSVLVRGPLQWRRGVGLSRRFSAGVASVGWITTFTVRSCVVGSGRKNMFGNLFQTALKARKRPQRRGRRRSSAGTRCKSPSGADSCGVVADPAAAAAVAGDLGRDGAELRPLVSSRRGARGQSGGGSRASRPSLAAGREPQPGRVCVRALGSHVLAQATDGCFFPLAWMY